jgi:transposase
VRRARCSPVTVMATVRRSATKAKRGHETGTFSTNMPGLIAVGDWLVARGVTRAGMESTGVYWKPVFYLLEDRDPEVWLLNAAHMKYVPGRKTDEADSVWIAQLVEHGLVRPLFVPPPIRELRDFTRYRRTLVEERTRAIQRLEKVLQDAGIKHSSVALTILTKSGWTILEAVLAGQSDPAVLDARDTERSRCGQP